MRTSKRSNVGVYWLIALAAFVLLGVRTGAAAEANDSPYRVVWDTPSTGWNQTMPLGNGEVCVNAYFDGRVGALRLLIARSDAWDELGRIVKLAEVGIADLGALNKSEPYEQVLDVERGEMTLVYGKEGAQTRVCVWVDSARPDVVVEVDSDRELSPRAYFYIWRGDNDRETLKHAEAGDLFWGSKTPAVVFPDVVATQEELGTDDQIAIYHRNVATPYFDEVSKIQGLDDYPDRVDPLTDRTFGCLISCDGAKRREDGSLVAPQGKSFRFDVVAHTKAKAESAADWIAEAQELAASALAVPFEERHAATIDYWRQLSERSWLRFTPNQKAIAELSEEERAQVEQETFDVTRAYVLQRFITACQGRGAFPIHFNGGLFCTAPVKGAPGRHDYRRWGPGYWFQNTRLAYYPMFASGDFEFTKSFFDMYLGLMPFCEWRVKKYFGDSFEGAYFPECIYFWGDVFPDAYGLTPMTERDDPLQTSACHHWEWVGGLETARLALQYYEYVGDEAFLKEKAIPFANSILKFFDSYYSVDPTSGKLKMEPAQALETVRGCVDPVTEVSGIRSVIGKLLELPEALTSESDREYWRGLLARTPEVPTTIDKETNKPMLAPAASYKTINNVETPELYPVFPFRLYSFDQPNVELAELAMERRMNKNAKGWRQDDVFYAYLGDAEHLRANLAIRARAKDPELRFPAFWERNYDWTPDQTHGGVMTTAAQCAVLQASGDTIFVKPALPKYWNAEFKLYAPKQTTVEGKIVDGEVAELNVEPASRRADVIVK